RAALDGNTAFASLELTATASTTLLTTFQFASTALTVTLNAVPAVRAVGVPVLPFVVPAAAVSPGASNCSFTNGPAVTVVEGLVLAVLLASVTSLAVTVWLPAVLKITLSVPVPETNAELGGRTAFASEDEMPTVSDALVTTFQLASTALTITLKATAAVCAVGVPVL